MKKTPFLKQSSEFEGFRVGKKISSSHDGEREVYLVTDNVDETFVLTLFNLSEGRYASAAKNKRDIKIAEIELCKGLPEEFFPALYQRGVTRRGRRRFAWMLQEYPDCNTLRNEVMMQSGLSRTDTLIVARKLLKGLRVLSQKTAGGGHYNITPDHILLDYDGDTLSSIRIIGTSAAGKPCAGENDFGSVCSDLHFSAPETEKGFYGFPADIYAVGMLMAYMLVGRDGPNLFGLPVEGSVNEFRRTVLDRVRELVPNPYMLVLNKATEQNFEKRLSSHASFCSVIDLLEKKELRGTMPAPPKGEFQRLDNTTVSARRHKEAQSGKYCKGTEGTVGGLASVAGMSELKVKLKRDFVDIVRNPSLATAYGIKPPNGILLYGAPGCGKTFIAENIAKESGLPYRVVNPSQFGSIYVHGSQGKIAEAFDDALKQAPMILIFDEFDAVVPSRDKADNQANEVNEMLTQLNNCADRGIYVICTSNRPDMIDPAVLRAGRVDAKYYVDLPDEEARRELFALELGKRPCAPDIDFERLCEATDGYTCGDISFVVKETARECFEEAVKFEEKGATVPITSERILSVISKNVPSVSPVEMKRYLELKSRMEHSDKSNMRRQVGFSSEAG